MVHQTETLARLKTSQTCSSAACSTRRVTSPRERMKMNMRESFQFRHTTFLPSDQTARIARLSMR